LPNGVRVDITSLIEAARRGQAMRHLRIFVSSPGDTDHERQRVDRVVERLNGEFAGTVRIETIRWETEFYRAHATFQAQIPAAAECEIVVAIFRHRIGSELPADFARLPGDRAYPSGSAYEVLSAIEACRAKGFPDVYVFRHPDPPMVRLDDPQAEQVHEQWRRLKEFFDEWFFAGDGPFKAAFQHFASTDEFEIQVDRLLRGWLEERVLHGRAVAWPIAVKGSPFRGLAAFGAKHAPVFFGRSREIARAIDVWKEAAARGAPFLLVLGASGAGKSSLAHAGLLPRLTAPGVVPAVDVWRVAAMRPLEMPGGPLEALATRLLDAEADLPDDERGRSPALPELADSDYRTPHQLAQLFAHPTAAATAPIRNALDRIARGARARHGYERDLRADLVLLVDQLDELFAPDLPAEQREAFVRLLQLLIETGRVWIVATLRADLYDRFLAEPVLLQLKTAGAACDLAPPGAAQLAEMVRQPADAAELVFETDPATGEQLDERLLREADRPDMLPLVQLALNRLFDERVAEGGLATLTFAAYDRLGGLAGIVDHVAETALAGLDEPAIATLPRLLRRLATVNHYATGDARSRLAGLTVRTMPLAETGGDEALRRLMQRLVDARILLTSGEGAAIGVRLAHERVLTDWRRARELVAASGEFYRVRDEVEEQRRRWESAGKSRDLLIPSGLPLAEAEAINTRFGSELERDTRDFIAASGRRAHRRQRFATVAAIVFALLAFAATGAGIVAHEQQERAERTLDAAKQAVNIIVVDVANGLRNIEGVRTATIRTVLQRIEKSVDWLTSDAPNDQALARLDLVMMDEFARTYMTAGDLDRARQAAAAALSKGRALAQRYPSDPEWRRVESVALNELGTLSLRTGDAAAAMRSFRQARDIMQNLLKSKPDDSQWQRDLSSSLSGIGDVRAQQGDIEGALSEYEQSLVIIRRLAHRYPHDAGLQRDHAVRLLYCGDMRHRLGERDAAIADYEEGLKIMRQLVALNGDDAQWQRDLFVNLTRLGDVRLDAGDNAGALGLYQEALSLAGRLAARDPSNPQLLWYIASSQGKVGDAQLNTGDLSAPAAAYERELAIMRQLVKQDASNAAWQRDLSVSLNKMADLKLLTGDATGALAVYQQGLAIVVKLTGRDPDNAVWLRDMAISHSKIGDLRLQTGDNQKAAAHYAKALAILQRLAARDPGNTQVQRDVSVTLNKLGDAWLRTGDEAKALAQYEAALAIVRRLGARDPGNPQCQWDLNYTLDKIGEAKLGAGDKAGALAAYKAALPIVQRLAGLDPGDARRQTDLVAGLYRVASASVGAERENSLRAALAILDKLQSDRKLAATQSRWPALIRAMLERPQ
jgi:eukaryotic-like serine/threonine-protein kinase